MPLPAVFKNKKAYVTFEEAISDQPFLKAGKINAYAILGREEYEERRKEIKNYQKAGSKGIV